MIFSPSTKYFRHQCGYGYFISKLAPIFSKTPSSVSLVSATPARIILSKTKQPASGVRPIATSTSTLPDKVSRYFYRHGLNGFENYQKIVWESTPRNILIVKKPNDKKTDKALLDITKWYEKNQPDVNIILEPQVAQELEEKEDRINSYVVPKGVDGYYDYERSVDLVIALGGDGTVLHVSSLFRHQVPPIVCFSMGTLGFLLPFNIQCFENVLSSLAKGSASVIPRMRLCFTKHDSNGDLIYKGNRKIMNEVCIHRGMYPHLTTLNCWLNDRLLTSSVADGLIVATPTGSTAYSLSAGGPIVHPSIEGLILTPICPRSLSFRTVVLPSNTIVRLQVSPESKGSAMISIDGHDTGKLENGQYLEIKQSLYPMLCVNRDDESSGWTHGINNLLKFNQIFSASTLPADHISENEVSQNSSTKQTETKDKSAEVQTKKDFNRLP